MLALNQQKAKLNNVNPRAEIHGEDFKMAADLSLEIKVSNDILNEFDASLKAALYRAPDANDDQADLLAGQDPNHMPNLKYPLMGPMKWGWKGAGYTLVVHYGVSGKDDIVMIQTEIDKFRFDCQDGGTVGVAFRVVAHPQAEELGRLCEMIQQEVTISLEPPSLEEQYQQQLKDANRGGDEE